MPDPWPEPEPDAVPAEHLTGWLRARGIACRGLPRLRVGFGTGRAQYRLERYPDPGPDGVLAMVFEWHTADFFCSPQAAHLAAGLCGPLPEDPHRGRGLALGMLCNRGPGPDGAPTTLFRGCPDPPGGPAMFIEDFTINEGTRPAADWQLSDCVRLPELAGDGVYRVEIQVSVSAVWAGVWRRAGAGNPDYRWLGETASRGLAAEPGARANAFIGQGFAREDNHSWIDHWTLAHWRTQEPDDLRPLSSTHSSR
jgi:hypothetical protein